MSDEFESVDDLDTPTEADLDEAYGSGFLGVVDVKKKFRTKIAKVRKEKIKDRNSGKEKTRFVLYLADTEKPWIIGRTIKDILVDALGKNPANWIGATIGVFVDPDVFFAGKRTGGVRLKVLLPPAKAPAPAPKATPAKPAASAPAAEEWTEEVDDLDPDKFERVA